MCCSLVNLVDMAVFGRLPMAQEIHLAQCGKCSRMVRLIDAAQHAGE